MPERLGYDPSEELTKGAEAAEQLSFSAQNGLEGILQQLYAMKEQGVDLEGSQREYSAEELATAIMQLLEVTRQACKSYDLALSQAVYRFGQNGEQIDIPAINVRDFPELQLLTRTAGLRDAVGEAIQQMVDEPRRMGPHGGLWIPGALDELYQRIVGTPETG